MRRWLGSLPLARRVYRALLKASAAVTERRVVRPFHRLFYKSGTRTWSNICWLGLPAQKCVFDLWIYQELLHELRPAVTIECGTADGGSALFLASICDLLGEGEVVTVDIEEKAGRAVHERITYLNGSSTAPEIVRAVEEHVDGRSPVLVILDSNHERDHVLEEMRLYGSLVTPGSYLIVEDTNINGHPVLPEFGPGPAEAIEAFLAESSEFTVDPSREKLILTFNPGGYLRKTGGRLSEDPQT
jgi:cephalosporin hydroxylase